MGFLAGLKERHPRRVWLVGGGDIAKQALLADLLDKMVLTVIPKCIGAGVRLFQGPTAFQKIGRSSSRARPRTERRNCFTGVGRASNL